MVPSHYLHQCWLTYCQLNTQEQHSVKVKSKYNNLLSKNYICKCCLRLHSTLSLLINSLWPSDPIWRHRSGSTLAQVMVCCLTAPTHNMNQSWLIFKGVLGPYPESNLIYELLKRSIWKVSLEFTLLKFYPNLPGANVLSQKCCPWCLCHLGDHEEIEPGHVVAM